jgi:hypothetical protein
VIQSTGDPFVKTNVIVRLLRSEVDHAQKDDPALTSLTPVNYMFFPKSTTTLDGRSVYIYEVKPRAKRLGLFKGRIYLDWFTGTLVRADGRIVKSPSVFIKSIRFVQKYVDVAGFTFPSHSHSEVRTRLVGIAVVDIDDQDYQPVSSATQAASREAPPSAQWMNFVCPEFPRAQHCRTYSHAREPDSGCEVAACQ